MEKNDRIDKIIKSMLEEPPIWVKNAFVLQNITSLPIGLQVLECLKIGVDHPNQIFDTTNNVHMTLFSFLSKQYNYMNDLMILADLYNRKKESNFYKLPTSSVWSIGAIASAMFDNLLCFAWIADDFINRADIFCDFCTIQDLDEYPTNVILENGINIDEEILKGCKRVAEKYKTKKAKFNSDKDYTNKNLYINEWYNNYKKNLKLLAEDISLNLEFANIKTDWNQIYKDYTYLCDFKHISPQKAIIFGSQTEQINVFIRVFRMGIKAFILTNCVLIKIHENNNIVKDKALLNIESTLSELSKLMIALEKK